MHSATEGLNRKIRSLTPEQLLKVEELIDTLQTEDQARSILPLSEPSFAGVWNDPENDVYDAH